MSKRTKVQLRNLKLYIIKNILNGRFVVRNLIAATIFVAVVAIVMTGVIFMGGGLKDSASGSKPVIVVNEMSNLDSNSVNIIMATFDAGSEPQVQPNDTEIVADVSNEFDNKFVAVAYDINVRAEASADSDIVGKLNYGNVGDIISDDGEWIYFTSGEVTGYVKSDYVIVGSEGLKYLMAGAEYTTATPVESEDSEEEGAMSKPETPSTEAPNEEPTEEEPEEEVTETPEVPSEEPTEEEPEEEPDDEHVGNYVTIETTYRSPIYLTDEEVNLVASIVMLESGGESYEGKLAVANVIFNRLQAGYWGSTVSDVIYSPYQFSTATSSSLDYYLKNGAPSSCVQAVRDAMSGTNNIGNFMSFRASYAAYPESYDSYTVIGNHVFFK
ncbi:MAG: cell wall hydrolase [Lachnospiraceae bacterium]|nr:cell wall hydrolase [Lachnospiraceae bacterium]